MPDLQMVEIEEKRTLTAKVFQREDGKKVHHLHVRHVHYEDWDGGIKDIDTSIIETPSGFEMTKAAYDLYAEKSIDAGVTPYQFVNEDDSISLLPRGLRWDNQEVVFQDTADVAASIEGKTIVYPNAFGASADLILELLNTGLRKVVRLNQALVPPVGVNFLEAGFELILPAGAEVWVQSESKQADVDAIRQQLITLENHRRTCERAGLFQEARATFATQQAKELELHDACLIKWDLMSDLQFSGEYQIRHNGVKTYGRIPMIWDSAGNSARITVELRNRNGKIYFAKLIPVTFLDTALFPVLTDTTTSYYAGAGDGLVRNNAGAVSWATARGAATGTFADPTTGANGLRMHTEFYSGTSYDIWRTFTPTDTSGINDGATITSAKLYLYTGADGVAKSDADTSSIYIVPTSQASTTTLTTADFDALTYTDYGNITIANVVASGYTAINLNATGIAAISKTGTTSIGVVEGRDFNNSAPTGINRVAARASEYAGTSNDPYLEIVTLDPTGYKNLLLMGVG